MIPNREKWHYLALKQLFSLLRGITSKHQGDFYCLNYLHCFATENKHESQKTLCENKNFRNIVMPSKGTKTLEFNQYQKSNKATFIIDPDLECLIEKIDGCKDNPENSFTTKHIPSGFSMSTISSFKNIQNEHNVYKGKVCVEKFC